MISNTKSKHNVMCYIKPLNNSSKQQHITNYFANLSVPPTSTTSSSHIQVSVPALQASAVILFTQRHTTPNNRQQILLPRRSRPATNSIHHYFSKIDLKLQNPSTPSNPSTPAAPSAPVPPHALNPPPLQQSLPIANLYKKTPASSIHKIALAHLHEMSEASSVQSESSTPSNAATRPPHPGFHTRSRIIRPPQRWTGESPPPRSSDSSHTSFSGSFVSPIDSTIGNSTVAISSFLLKELEEISVLKKSMTEMMSQSDQILQQLHNADLPPTEVIIQPDRLNDAFSRASQNAPCAHEFDSNSDESSTLIIRPTPSVSDISLQNSTGSFQSTRSILHIHETNNRIFDTLLDDVQTKHDQNYRIVMQNVNGIKEFHQKDPDYYPTLRALQRAGADHLCLVETNTPWHMNDLLYEILMVHEHVWSTPTKTTGASCRSEKALSRNYQPGGVLYITANSLTTKINTVSSDGLGRWTKTIFFAKQGSLVIYTIYRPNPGSLQTSGINCVWVQQYRSLCKKNPKVDPRQQFIDDIIQDVLQEQAMHGKIIIAGDLNEDPSEGKLEGKNKIIDICALCNAFETVKSHMPSTRSNHRAIDHFLVSPEIIPHIIKMGVLPDETGFTSDHAGLFLDLAPQVLETKNNPITPPKMRKLKMYNRVKVQQYVDYVLGQFESRKIITKLKDLHKYVSENMQCK